MVLSDDEIELDEALRNLVAKGLIEEVPGGYRITERGIGCYETHLDCVRLSTPILSCGPRPGLEHTDCVYIVVF
jgi:hypothetical protein